jgi:hypothetical protein
LLVQCNYTEAVWNLISTALALPNYSYMGAIGGPNRWIQVLCKIGSKKEKYGHSLHLLVVNLEGEKYEDF